MTTQINQLTELTTTSDGDLLLIRESATGVDKKIQSQNLRAKATTKDDVGLGNVPNLDTTDAVAGNFSSVNIDGGNIDGTAIGASSASSGAFTTLTASDDVNFDSGTLFVDASANRVGIGTTSPTEPLTVSGDVKAQDIADATDNIMLRSSSNVPRINFTADNTFSMTIGYRGPSASNPNLAELNVVENADLQFYTNNTPAMRIDSSGNVGIGVTSITNYSGRSNLTLGGTTNTGLLEFVNSGGSQAYIYGDANGILNIQARPTSSESTQVKINSAGDSGIIALQTDNQERMRIDSSGRVGIGTSTPNRQLELANSTNPALRFNTTGTGTYHEIAGFSNSLFIDADPNNNAGGGSINFRTAQNERMRIDSSGHAIIPAGVTLGTSAGVYNAANTLDDYEEGTWTPTVFIGFNGTATLSSSAGYYVKIGKVVFLFGKVVLSSKNGNTQQVQIRNVPFSSTYDGFQHTTQRGNFVVNDSASVPNANLSCFKGTPFGAQGISLSVQTPTGTTTFNATDLNDTSIIEFSVTHTID